MDDEQKNKDEQETEQNGQEEGRSEGDERVSDAETAFEEYTSEKKCPECDEPIIDVRANCPNCGYEYQESDYEDKEAGAEFVAGSAVDDEGNEIPDDETGGADEDDDGSDEGKDEEADDDEDGSEEK